VLLQLHYQLQCFYRRSIAIKDYAGTFATNNLTIARNGHNIQGVANNSLISTNRASLVLVYVDATKGWLFTDEHNVADLQGQAFLQATGGTVTTSGDFKIHTFTGDGCFVFHNRCRSSGGPSNVDYLVVAGGGGRRRIHLLVEVVLVVIEQLFQVQVVTLVLFQFQQQLIQLQ
jgi:hypothetical protein